MTVRTEPCVCGESITADDADPTLAVLRHSRGIKHSDWRRRALFKRCPGVGSTCAVDIPWTRDLCQYCKRTLTLLERQRARTDVA